MIFCLFPPRKCWSYFYFPSVLQTVLGKKTWTGKKYKLKMKWQHNLFSHFKIDYQNSWTFYIEIIFCFGWCLCSSFPSGPQVIICNHLSAESHCISVKTCFNRTRTMSYCQDTAGNKTQLYPKAIYVFSSFRAGHTQHHTDGEEIYS